MGVSFDLDKFPNCCGCYEAGMFDEYSSTWKRYNVGNWKEALDTCIEEVEGQPLFFNFFREAILDEDDDAEIIGYEEEYKASELRELVRNHPNVRHIGCFKNKNSGNIVDSYVIFSAEDASNE